MKLILIVLGVIITLYIVSVVYLALSVGRFTSYWKNRVTQSASKNALVYVALGDSAAQGVGATTPTKGYVGQFAKRLSSKSGRPVQIINLSKSGAKIQDVIKDQIPQLAKYKADLITLDIGGNDIATFNAGTFKTEFADLITKLPAKTLVADVPYFGGRTQLPFFGSGAAEKSVVVANQIITEVANNTSVIVVPIHTITKDRNGSRIWNYAPDYFHPNNIGYQAWTDAFWDSYNKSN